MAFLTEAVVRIRKQCQSWKKTPLCHVAIKGRGTRSPPGHPVLLLPRLGLQTNSPAAQSVNLGASISCEQPRGQVCRVTAKHVLVVPGNCHVCQVSVGPCRGSSGAREGCSQSGRSTPLSSAFSLKLRVGAPILLPAIETPPNPRITTWSAEKSALLPRGT